MLCPRRLGWILLLFGAALLVLWGARLGRIGWALLEDVRQVQAMADAPESVEPLAACCLVRELRDDLTTLRREGGGLVRLAPLLGWLPRVGGDLQAAPHLLAVADGLTEAGVVTCDALDPALAAFGQESGTANGFSAEGLARLLADGRPAFEQALAAAERAQTAWAEVDKGRLSPWLAAKTSLLDRALPLLRSGLQAASVAPELLGVDNPRTYLILALNEDERRPIGGFITGVGEVRVEGGRVAELTFCDSYAVDDFTQPYPDPPEPLQRYLGIDQWVFRDSNWSPDFPTSARQAISLYRPGHSASIDGVIAVDQWAVQQLLDVFGPLHIEGAEEAVSGETVMAYMRRAWAPEDGALTGEWWRQRKSFMEPLAGALWEQLESGDVEWVALARTLVDLLEEKHLLVYLDQPDAARVLSEQGWDGALRPWVGDFLMVVDANVGYNRASARVEQEIFYEVDLDASSAQATLTLVYTHTSGVDYPCVREIRYDLIYEWMMDRCYWDYLRVYVPQGSRLVDATRIPVPDQALFSGDGESGEIIVQPAGEGPWLTYAVLGLLPPQSIQVRSFTWTLPADVVKWQGDQGVYSLLVQKQAGTRWHPLTVRLRLPAESVLLEAKPEPFRMDGGWIIYQTTLDRDRAFQIHFGRDR